MIGLIIMGIVGGCVVGLVFNFADYVSEEVTITRRGFLSILGGSTVGGLLGSTIVGIGLSADGPWAFVAMFVCAMIGGFVGGFLANPI